MSKTKSLTTMLKKRWLSNHQAILIFKSAHADRRIREIRKNPPEGYTLAERVKTDKIYGKNTTFKQFKLIPFSTE